MARKRRAVSVETPLPPTEGYDPIPDRTRLSWFNPSLSVQDKLWLKNNPDKFPGLLAELVENLPVGFFLSLKFSLRDECWVCTLVCQDANHDAAAQAISVRGSSAARAIIALAYHLASLNGEPWWDDTSGDNQLDW